MPVEELHAKGSSSCAPETRRWACQTACAPPRRAEPRPCRPASAPAALHCHHMYTVKPCRLANARLHVAEGPVLPPVRRLSVSTEQAEHCLRCHSGKATLCRSRCSHARQAGQRQSPGTGASTSPSLPAKRPTCCKHKALIVQPTHQPARASTQLKGNTSTATCHGKATQRCHVHTHTHTHTHGMLAGQRRCTGCALELQTMQPNDLWEAACT